MKFTLHNLLRWSFFLFVFAIPLGTKKFLFDFPTPFSNWYVSEYTSAFLYGSDILLFIFLLFLFWEKPFACFKEWFRGHRKQVLFLSLFLIFVVLSLFSADYKPFAFYSFARLLLVAIMALAVGFVLREGMVKWKEIAVVLSLSAAVQALVGFLQFTFQKSLGLWFLGESVIAPWTKGVAKITVGGIDYIRVYGTMPHANILAGFLAIGLASLFCLFLEEKKLFWRAIESAGIFMVFTTLLLTFSRSGWIVALIITILAILFGLFKREYRRGSIQLTITVLACLLLLLTILGWLVFSRAHLSADESPVKDRWSYDKIGVTLVVSHPFGVGIGNELFYAYHNGLFDKYDLRLAGQWQPIHNLYLLMSSEIGIFGLLAFLLFLFSLFSRNAGSEVHFTEIALIGLLLFGLFDHFLWDLEAGRLMLWVILGIMMGLGPHGSMDRVQASEA